MTRLRSGLALLAIAVASLLPATAQASTIAAGKEHTCALSSGEVWCWGGAGLLGDGSQVASATPARVSGISDATSIAAGSDHTCALRSGGKVSCWGYGIGWRLGYAHLGGSLTPVDAPGITGATSISAGGAGTCVVQSGQLWCWGQDLVGAAIAVTVDGSPSHFPAPFDGAVTGAQRADGITCVEEPGHDGLRCVAVFTPNGAGTDIHTSAVAVPDADGLRSISGDTRTWCGVRADLRVRCAGRGDKGQLGDGRILASDATGTSEVSNLTGVTQVATGTGFSCALVQGGSVRCWGTGTSGELGVGEGLTGPETTPTAVAGLTDAVELAAGMDHVCARTREGAILCWGSGRNAKNGSAVDRFVPSKVASLTVPQTPVVPTPTPTPTPTPPPAIKETPEAARPTTVELSLGRVSFRGSRIDLSSIRVTPPSGGVCPKSADVVISAGRRTQQATVALTARRAACRPTSGALRLRPSLRSARSLKVRVTVGSSAVTTRATRSK